MLGSTAAKPLPAGGLRDSGTSGTVARDALVPGLTATREPTVEPPLLRGPGVELVGAVSRSQVPLDGLERAGDRSPAVQAIVAQLTPIRTRAALLASFAREANPHDELVRAAYACAWSDLMLGISRGGTRRARIRATMARPRSGLRARG